MANAKKCDRCGIYYDSDDYKFRIARQENDFFKSGSYIDLCNGCCENFNIWLSGIDSIEG